MYSRSMGAPALAIAQALFFFVTVNTIDVYHIMNKIAGYAVENLHASPVMWLSQLPRSVFVL